VIANAGVDQDVVVRRLHDEALEGEHDLARGGVEVGGLEPGAVLLQHLLGKRREEIGDGEHGRLALEHAVDGEVPNP
jgi:hypothetical protein